MNFNSFSPLGEMDKNVSPNWKRPEEVMKFHWLKQKKRALSARISGNDNVASLSFSQNSNSEDSFIEFPQAKRRNPFIRKLDDEVKKEETTDESGVEADISSDNSLFHSLNQTQSKVGPSTPRSFKNILRHLQISEPEVLKEVPKQQVPILIDWTLKTKVRFMSSRPFAWSGTLRTCEEASGITGFTRCLDISSDNANTRFIDTSPNAKFHQCCLFWQHPSLPWLKMYPRSNNKVSSSLISAQLQIAESMLAEWMLAFKSLFQLVRVKQCPFFYMVANHFHCLFRAAGIGGVAEIHAIITPTTRGFRKMLDDEDIVYAMPFKGKKKNEEVVDEDEEDWLEAMGVDSKEMKRLATSQKNIERNRERQIDGSNESLILVEGVDVQALFNVLVNCKSCVAVSGPLAGVPPTLLSPVAFQLSTLRSCQVKDCVIRVDGSDFHSVQVEGPILPHALRQMCLLLDRDGFEYSASVATDRQTIGFATALKERTNLSTTPVVFLKENISDCGLSKELVEAFCDPDQSKYGVNENITSLLPDP